MFPFLSQVVFPLKCLQVGIYHHLDQLLEGDGGLPTQLGASLGGIGHQKVHVGWAEEPGVHHHVIAPVQVEVAEGHFAKLSHRVGPAGTYHVVIWLVLLEHEPHGLHEVPREAPVPLRFQIPKRQLIRKTQFDESVRLGKEIIDKENQKNRRLGFAKVVQRQYAELGYDSLERLYAAVGSGLLTVPVIYSKLFPKATVEEKKKDTDTLFLEKARSNVKGVKVHGIVNMMVNFAKCCNPIPGDSIIGFVSRGRGIIVHKSDCGNIPALLKENERLLDVDWDVNNKQQFLAQIKIMAQERKHFLRDVVEAVSATNTNIISIDGNVDDTIIYVTLVLQVGNLNHLTRIISKIRSIQGIITVERK